MKHWDDHHERHWDGHHERRWDDHHERRWDDHHQRHREHCSVDSNRSPGVSASGGGPGRQPVKALSTTAVWHHPPLERERPPPHRGTPPHWCSPSSSPHRLDVAQCDEEPGLMPLAWEERRPHRSYSPPPYGREASGPRAPPYPPHNSSHVIAPPPAKKAPPPAQPPRKMYTVDEVLDPQNIESPSHVRAKYASISTALTALMHDPCTCLAC